MDADTLTELLSGRHFNMEERIKRGAWPHPPLRYSELLDHIASLVDRQGHFPRPYVAHVRRGYAGDPYTIAEETAREFSSAREAADFYLRWEFALPGNLDGWEVLT